MITKLTCWLAYSMVVACVLMVVALAAKQSPQGAIACAAAAIFFGFVGAAESRALDEWRDDSDDDPRL